MYQFLWKGHDKVKRDTIIGKVEEGGLGMIEVSSFFKSLKAGWVLRILNSIETINWSYFENMLFKEIGFDKTLHGTNSITLHESYICKDWPPFYKQVLEGYCGGNRVSMPTSNNDLMNTIIWGNNFIVNKKRECLYFTEWIKSGIIYFKDIKFVNKRVDETFIYATVKNKCNIISQLYQLKMSLTKFHDIIHDQSPECANKTNKCEKLIIRTKYYYLTYLKKIFQVPKSQTFWMENLTWILT